MKPIGNRVILKVEIIKQNEQEVPSQEGKVIKSNNPEISRGDTVFYNPYGAVSVDSKRTKKNLILVVDEEDIYAKI